MELASSSKQYLIIKLRAWGKANFVSYPWRSTLNMWHALVAEIMLQRTRVKQVVPVYTKFTKDFPSPGSYKYSNNIEAKNFFVNLGLSWRFEIFQETVNFIVENGIPDNRAELMEVPGIGDYIASAYLSFHQGKREIIIDSNIVRFYGRFFGFEYNNETRRKKWFFELADTLTPTRKVGTYNYALLDFSMNVCSSKPDCENCILRRKCIHYGQSKSKQVYQGSRC